MFVGETVPPDQPGGGWTFTNISFYASLSITILSVLYSAHGIYSIWKTHAFSWVKYMSIMILFTCMCTLYHFLPWRLEGSPWHYTHPRGEQALMTSGIFFFYFSQNLEYWLLGYTYWCIANEIRSVMADDQEPLDA